MTTNERLGISAPWMQVRDLEPAQWGRLYHLLVPANRASTGLYILHDQGRVVSVTPAYAQSQLGLPSEIDDPEVAAAELYPIWGQGPVAIFEKEALKATFDRIQRARTDNDDIFTFLIKLVSEWANEAGIVVHPNPFEKWRTVSPTLPRVIAHAVAPDNSPASFLITIYDGNELYLSLLLGFENRELTLITTLPAAPITDWRADHQRLTALAADQFAPVTFGVYCPLTVVERIGISPDALPAWLEAEQRGEIICTPVSLAEIAARITANLG